jgi:hypothetical protein
MGEITYPRGAAARVHMRSMHPHWVRWSSTWRRGATYFALAIASVFAGATPASANPHDGLFGQSDFRIRQLAADINQTTSTITVAGTVDRSMADHGLIVIMRPAIFVDQLCRSRDDPTVTITAHGTFNAFSQMWDFAIQQPSLAQPGNQLDWAGVLTFINPTDPAGAAGYNNICPTGYLPADLSGTKPAYVVTGAQLTMWPGPFSPQRDKFGHYIGYLVMQFPVGVTVLNRAEIDRSLVLN